MNPWQIAAFLVVADGMGGHHGGEVASQLAGATARQIFLTDQAQGLTRADVTGAGLAQRVTESIQYINRVVYKHDAGHSGDTQRKPGTTLTMALVRADEYCIGHVGDSRAYLIHEERGVMTAEQITVDDSLVAAAVRDGRLTPEQARTSPFRNHLSQAIGIDNSVEPQVLSGSWQAGDTLLICSDGLTEYLSETELADFVATHDSLQAACDGLVTVANHRGGVDNISVVAARVGKGVATPVEKTDIEADDSGTAPLSHAPLIDELRVAAAPADRATVPSPAPVAAQIEPAADATPQAAPTETIEPMPKPVKISTSPSGRLVGRKLSLLDRLMTPAGLATVAGLVIVSTVFGVMAGRHRNASNGTPSATAPTSATVTATPVTTMASPVPTVEATGVSATPGATPGVSSVVITGPTTAPLTAATFAHEFAPVSIWLDPERKAIFVACKNFVVHIRSGANKNRAVPDPDRPHRALVEFRHWEAAYTQLQNGTGELLCRVRPIRTTPGPEFVGKPYRSQQDGQGHIKIAIPDTDPNVEYSLQFAKPGSASGQELATFRVARK